MKLYYMKKDEIVSEFVVSLSENKIYINQIGINFLDTPFGDSKHVSIEQFFDFLEDRCFPRERQSCKEYLLPALGLTEYDPLAIVQITHGLQWDDFYWIKFEGEDITYDKIALRV